MNTSKNMELIRGGQEAPAVPPIPSECPQDYTHRTTLLQKGKLAPNGYVWMELSVANFNTGKLQPGEPRRNVGRFSAPIPVGLTKEQKDYFAARMRMRIKDETGK